MPPTSIEQRAAQVLEFARELANQGCTADQIRTKLYGEGGKVLELFPSSEEGAAFTATAAYRDLKALLASLARPRDALTAMAGENTAAGQLVLDVPEKLFIALRAEAAAEHISMDSLCLKKLARPPAKKRASQKRGKKN